MAVRIRVHSLADHPELVAQVAAWHFGEWGVYYPGESLQDWCETLAESAPRGAVPATWIALDEGGAPIGSASLVESDMDTHADLSPWLASVYVVPERRGAGVGKVLVRHAMRAARAMGVPQLYLFTAGAERFYAALGWQLLMRERYRGREVAIMAIAPLEAG